MDLNPTPAFCALRPRAIGELCPDYLSEACSVCPEYFERIGRAVQTLGVPYAEQFTSASALVNYILGVGSQNAANARMHKLAATRPEFLAAAATAWSELDVDAYAFTRSMAGPLRDHDDRAEFLAGIDLILAGIAPLPA